MIDIRINPLRALHTLTEAVATEQDIDQVLSAAYDQILSIVEPDLMVIYLRDRDMLISKGEKPHNPRWNAHASIKKKVGTCLCGLVVSEKKPIYAINIHTDPRCTLKECKNAGIVSFAALPLSADNAVFGVMGLGSVTPRDFSKESDFIEIAVNQISIGLKNAILRKKILREKAQLEKIVEDQRRTLSALAESERKYRIILDTIEDGYYEVDLAGNFVFFNTAMRRMLGYADAEMMDMNNRKFMDQENAKNVFQTFNRVYLTGKPEKAFDWVLIHRDGSKRHIDTSVTLISDANATAIGFRGIARDITERKRVEKTVQQEKNFSEKLINSLPGIFYLFTAEGKFLRWNQNFETVSEYSAAEIKKMTPGDLFEGAEKEYIRQQIQEVFTTGHGDAEANFVSKSGRRIPHYFTGQLIHIDNQPHLIGMGIDITDRKLSEAALKKSQEQYRGVVENASDAIVILQDGMIVFYNQRTESLTGYSAKDLFETPFINFIAPDDQERVLERYQRKLNGEVFGDGAFSFGIIDKNGNELWVESNIALVSLAGKTAIQCFLRDATFQKKLEAQLRQAQKLEAIGTLAGGIAHDFNNILSIILGNIEMAMFNIPDWNPAWKNLDETKKACFMAIEIVRQILSFSRQMEQEQKSVDLCTVILESLKLLRFSIPTTIEIRHYIPETPYFILADPAQIHQVIINLCTNAAHAMKETGGVLEVRLKETVPDVSSLEAMGLSPGRYVQVSVKDTGHGIDPDIVNRIFDPYFTTKKVGEGSGLGLAVVHGIVKNQGGAITVKSVPGNGSDFQIYFPKVQQQRAQPIDSEEKLLGGTETILLVDDEASLADIGKQMLTFLGYAVEARTSPIDALTLFRADPYAFDLVITDMTMPQMTGKALAKEMVRIRPDIPIILNTGHSDQIDESIAKATGIMAYLMKPMNMTVLSQTIRKLLDSR